MPLGNNTLINPVMSNDQSLLQIFEVIYIET
jgi:hypothetical protein